MKKLLLIVFPLLFLGLVGGAVWWKYGRQRDPYTLAQQMIEKGDLKGAQLELRSLLRQNPQNVGGHYRLGLVELRLGDAVAAEKDLKTARDMGMEARTVTPPLAQAYMAQGHYRELLRDFSTEGLPPDQAGPLLVMRAMAQLSTGDTAAAATSAAEAERATPQLVDAVLASARVAVAQQNFPLAQLKADRALQINPRSTDALMLKGQLLNLQGDRVHAQEQFDAALAVNPNLLSVRLERANLLMVINQDDRAKEDVDAALKLEPRSALGIFLQGVLLTKKGDYAGADAAFTKIANVLPRMPRGYFFLAIDKYNLGQAEQASEAATNYLVHNPADADGIKVFAKIELASQRSAKVIEVLTRAVNAGRADVDMLDLLGRAYAMAGKPDQAVQTLERAATLAPRNPEILTRLASVRLSLGDAATAASDFQQVLAIAPEQKGVSAALVQAAIAAGDVDHAATTLTQMRKTEGDSETVGNLQALLQMAQLDLDGAAATLADVIKRFPDAIQPRINLAKLQILQDHPADAQKTLAEVLTRQPANIDALQRMIGLLLGDGHLPRAVEVLQAAHNAAPKDTNVLVTLVTLYARSGDSKTAQTLLDQAIKDQPTSTALLNERAQIQQSLGQTAAARDTYRAIIDQTPTDVATRRVLANLLVAANDSDGAKAVISEGLKAVPGDISLLQSYVAIVLQANGLDAALASADQLAKDPANLPDGRLLRGDVYVAAGRFADAAATYAQELKTDPRTPTLLRTISALNAAGRTEQATQMLRDWLASHSDDADAADALATLDIIAHRFFDAEAHLQLVLSKRPGDAAALNNLAWVYQQRGDAKAQPTAQKSFLINPSPQAADTLGWILTTQGNAANALSLLRQAAAQIPGDPTVQYHLAVALRDTGHRDEALQRLTAVVNGLVDFDDRPAATKALADMSKPK